MGKRLLDIIFDKQEDLLYEDKRAMLLTHYVMAERCLQVELEHIITESRVGDHSTLTYILEGGFKGFKNMEPSELIEEYKAIEDQWYDLEETNELHWEPYEDDPIHTLKEKV